MVLYFRLDTGTEVTAISEETFKPLGSSKVQQPVKKPLGFTNKLMVLGRLTVYKINTVKIFLINDLQHNLLVLPAIKLYIC